MTDEIPVDPLCDENELFFLFVDHSKVKVFGCVKLIFPLRLTSHSFLSHNICANPDFTEVLASDANAN